ncbi:trimeric intracellular cation channel family protein [Thalassotalea sp. LPB0316]|uniref:trimeric intracellular cation channel family protein n=1 Tax=Thalassotalea sp. LPB0316 TaxID=2769490 RepID=UPI0018680DF6|nr:trimeric intracellular cation channel family protein [Thalassotalea sp. LPB0316]QOL26061.1 trimeric intracellular cation channel family protein [Thalassotalea sp. LPB0316]
MTLVYWLDLFGVAVFALSGALMAGRYQLDPFGVIVLAAVTAVGGGTIRDIILGAPVFWLNDVNYLYIIVTTALLTILIIRQPSRIPRRFLLIADAFGLALFAVLGTQKALSFGTPMSIAMVMGILTGCAGGMIRDVLCNVIPMILRQEIYATAALVGGALFCGLLVVGLNQQLATVIAIVGALSLRLAAIYWQLSLPAFEIVDDSERLK